MEDLLGLAGNVILAPILLWFMKQNTELIKKLIGQQGETKAVISQNTEVVRENRETMEKVREVIVKCDKK